MEILKLVQLLGCLFQECLPEDMIVVFCRKVVGELSTKQELGDMVFCFSVHTVSCCSQFIILRSTCQNKKTEPDAQESDGQCLTNRRKEKEKKQG